MIGGRQETAIEVRRIADGEILGRFHGQRFIVDFWFTPDEELFALAREDGVVELWRLPSADGGESPNRVIVHAFDGGRINCMGFFPDSRQLLVGPADGPIRLCRLVRNEGPQRILESLALEHPPGSVKAIRVGPDGRTVIAVGSAAEGEGGWLATWHSERDEERARER